MLDVFQRHGANASHESERTSPVAGMRPVLLEVEERSSLISRRQVTSMTESIDVDTDPMTAFNAFTDEPFVYVDDLDAHLKQAEGAGATIISPINEHGFRSYSPATPVTRQLKRSTPGAGEGRQEMIGEVDGVGASAVDQCRLATA